MEDKKFHCKECAGHAKAREEECFTCDGEGKPKAVKEKVSKKK